MIRCKSCNQRAVKNGFQNKVQRYKCTVCNKVFKLDYQYKAYHENTNQDIVRFLKEGVGIRGISRLTGISTTTVLSRIKRIADSLTLPVLVSGKTYEVDEMCTYIGSKDNRKYICLGLRKDTKEVVRISIGNRSMKMLKEVTVPISLSKPKTIYTDRLNLYRLIIERQIHKIKKGKTNTVERINLNLRIHLKRLSRRSICYTKSTGMLMACLKIYFWF